MVLNFVWNPDLSKLTSASVVTATGQIFFTLSLGMGIICNYASYLQADEDIVAASVATVSLNEFAEVILCWYFCYTYIHLLSLDQKELKVV